MPMKDAMVRKITIGIAIVCIVTIGYLVYHNKHSTTATTPPVVASVSNAIVTTKLDAKLGKYLVTPAGFPLYTYGGDSNNISNCNVACLMSWPAYIDTGPTTGLPANFGVITRSDNSESQFTYKGHPLYTFVHDQPGQINGNDISLFKVATP